MRTIIAILIILVVAACSSTPKTNVSQISVSEEAAPTSSSVPAATASFVPTQSIDVSSLTSEVQQLEKHSDYFDFDMYAIKPEYQEVIKKEAEFLIGHKNDHVTLEGNADERGTIEYNYELGDRRANAVRMSLVNLGVPSDQILMISYGKEKPRLLCHTEKCWKENRRVDFVYKLG